MGTVFKNFQKVLAVLLAGFTVVSISACSSYEEFDGKVIDKRIGSHYENVCSIYNKDGLCTVYVPVKREDYYLKVTDSSTNETGEWKIKRSVYNSCEKNNYVHRETNGDVTCSDYRNF